MSVTLLLLWWWLWWRGGAAAQQQTALVAATPDEFASALSAGGSLSVSRPLVLSAPTASVDAAGGAACSVVCRVSPCITLLLRNSFTPIAFTLRGCAVVFAPDAGSNPAAAAEAPVFFHLANNASVPLWGSMSLAFRDLSFTRATDLSVRDPTLVRLAAYVGALTLQRVRAPNTTALVVSSVAGAGARDLRLEQVDAGCVQCVVDAVANNVSRSVLVSDSALVARRFVLLLNATTTTAATSLRVEHSLVSGRFSLRNVAAVAFANSTLLQSAASLAGVASLSLVNCTHRTDDAADAPDDAAFDFEPSPAARSAAAAPLDVQLRDVNIDAAAATRSSHAFVRLYDLELARINVSLVSVARYAALLDVANSSLAGAVAITDVTADSAAVLLFVARANAFADNITVAGVLYRDVPLAKSCVSVDGARSVSVRDVTLAGVVQARRFPLVLVRRLSGLASVANLIVQRSALAGMLVQAFRTSIATSNGQGTDAGELQLRDVDVSGSSLNAVVDAWLPLTVDWLVVDGCNATGDSLIAPHNVTTLRSVGVSRTLLQASVLSLPVGFCALLRDWDLTDLALDGGSSAIELLPDAARTFRCALDNLHFHNVSTSGALIDVRATYAGVVNFTSLFFTAGAAADAISVDMPGTVALSSVWMTGTQARSVAISGAATIVLNDVVSTGARGGAVALRDFGTAAVTGLTIDGALAPGGTSCSQARASEAPFSANAGSALTLHWARITNSSAVCSAAAVSIATVVNVTLTGSIVAQNAGARPAIEVTNAQAGEVRDCRIFDNWRDAAADASGALSWTSSRRGATLLVANSSFTNNSASIGAAVYADGTDVLLANVVLANNTARDGAGAAVFVRTAALRLERAFVSGNAALGPGIGGAIAAFASAVSLADVDVRGTVSAVLRTGTSVGMSAATSLSLRRVSLANTRMGVVHVSHPEGACPALAIDVVRAADVVIEDLCSCDNALFDSPMVGIACSGPGATRVAWADADVVADDTSGCAGNATVRLCEQECALRAPALAVDFALPPVPTVAPDGKSFSRTTLQQGGTSASTTSRTTAPSTTATRPSTSTAASTATAAPLASTSSISGSSGSSGEDEDADELPGWIVPLIIGVVACVVVTVALTFYVVWARRKATNKKATRAPPQRTRSGREIEMISARDADDEEGDFVVAGAPLPPRGEYASATSVLPPARQLDYEAVRFAAPSSKGEYATPHVAEYSVPQVRRSDGGSGGSLLGRSDHHGYQTAVVAEPLGSSSGGSSTTANRVGYNKVKLDVPPAGSSNDSLAQPSINGSGKLRKVRLTASDARESAASAGGVRESAGERGFVGGGLREAMVVSLAVSTPSLTDSAGGAAADDDSPTLSVRSHSRHSSAGNNEPAGRMLTATSGFDDSSV